MFPLHVYEMTFLSRTTVRDGVLPFLSMKPPDIKGDIETFPSSPSGVWTR